MIRYYGKAALAEEFARSVARKARKLQLRRLRKAREVHDNQNSVFLIFADEAEDLRIFHAHKFKRPTAEGFPLFAKRDGAAHPPQQRGRVAVLVFDVDGF